MPSSLVFITGGSGFIGAQVVLAAVRAGYNVRLSVRRTSQIDTLRRVFADFTHQLDFIVIPDLTDAAAYNDAFNDVDHVIHVASPLPKPGEDILTPAVKGTVAVLEVASHFPRIKKVIITASVISLVPIGGGYDGIVVHGECTPLVLLATDAEGLTFRRGCRRIKLVLRRVGRSIS